MAIEVAADLQIYVFWQLYPNRLGSCGVVRQDAEFLRLYLKLEAPANYASASVSRSAPLGARTLDTLIKSQVLYQLS